MTTKLFGGMEGGGSKIVCAVGSGPDNIVAEVRIPTTTPGETLGSAITFFQKYNISARWRKPAETFPKIHPAWDQEAAYIGYTVANIILTLSPQRIILGGSVLRHQPHFPSIRDKLRGLLNGYIAAPILAGTMEGYIVPPAFGNRSAVLGALALAKALVTKG